MKKLIPFGVLLLSINCFAQDSTTTNPRLITKKPFARYRADRQLLKTQKDVKAEIFKVPSAIPLYNKSQKNLIIGSVLLIPAGGFLLLGRPAKNINSPQFGKRKVGYNVTALAFALGSCFFTFRSSSLFKASIREHNRNVKTTY